MMNPLEEQLRNVLKRQEPPDGFSERLLSRIKPRSKGWRENLASLFRLPALRWAMAGAFILCLLVTGIIRHQREQRLSAEGEMAKAQVIQALRIASVKLNATRKKINETGRRTTQLRPPVEEDSFRVKA